MSAISVVYADQWGDVLDRAGDDCLEIRWFDTTSEMSGEDFKAFLTRYAEHFAACGRRNGLVDAVQFKSDSAYETMGWRDENIVPRYNAAGMLKFAFVMPAGMPAIGTEPAAEGPAEFPTGYFGGRADALEWLRS